MTTDSSERHILIAARLLAVIFLGLTSAMLLLDAHMIAVAAGGLSAGIFLWLMELLAGAAESAKAELRSTSAKYQALFEQAGDYLLVLEARPDGPPIILDLNEAALLKHGYSREELIGRPISVIDPENDDTATTRHRSELARSGQARFEVVHRRKDGTTFTAEASLRRVDLGGGKSVFLSIERDVTERSSALEIQLRELHHRIKNNMAVIASLLNLQSARVPDPFVRGLFEESHQRIRSMALVHEHLHKSSKIKFVDFGPYTERLIADLSASYASPGKTLGIKVDVRDVTLELETAIPCGLIINEAVSNSLKYAFPDGGGEVRVRFEKDGGSYELVIEDDGVGLPAGLDTTKRDSLGLRLIHALSGQLAGSAEIANGAGDAPRPGTRVRVTFPVK